MPGSKLGTWDIMGEKRISNRLPIVVAGQGERTQERVQAGQSRGLWKSGLLMALAFQRLYIPDTGDAGFGDVSRRDYNLREQQQKQMSSHARAGLGSPVSSAAHAPWCSSPACGAN